MGLVRETEPWGMTADQAAQRKGYRAQAELVLRNALEGFCRKRWRTARIVHEIVMGEGRVRADVAAIGPKHMAAFEVKGEYDDTTRLLHQVGMYQLCVPEVWMVVPVGRHADDARLIRHLLPSVGLLVGAGTSKANHYEFDGKDFGLVVEAEAVPRPPVPEMTLAMLWADELRGACVDLGVGHGPKSTRSNMMKSLLELDHKKLLPAVCRQLRGRDAIWRADPPVPATVKG